MEPLSHRGLPRLSWIDTLYSTALLVMFILLWFFNIKRAKPDPLGVSPAPSPATPSAPSPAEASTIG